MRDPGVRRLKTSPKIGHEVRQGSFIWSCAENVMVGPDDGCTASMGLEPFGQHTIQFNNGVMRLARVSGSRSLRHAHFDHVKA